MTEIVSKAVSIDDDSDITIFHIEKSTVRELKSIFNCIRKNDKEVLCLRKQKTWLDIIAKILEEEGYTCCIRSSDRSCSWKCDGCCFCAPLKEILNTASVCLSGPHASVLLTKWIGLQHLNIKVSTDSLSQTLPQLRTMDPNLTKLIQSYNKRKIGWTKHAKRKSLLLLGSDCS